ncbi:MAG TPA: hypothetical protein VMH28_11205 [Candidatus Acidoferrales bacterium]|nr:hypothetical protein [Candidatus Acidoferrales bacterium]
MNRVDRIVLLVTVGGFAFAAGLSGGSGAAGDGSSIQAAPIHTTLCELAASPERFQGKVVEFRATVQTGLQTSLVRDDTCSVYMWLAGTDLAQGAEARDEGKASLKEDRQYQKMRDSLDKKYKPKDGSICSRCPLYKVTATVVGRFEHIQKREEDGVGGAPVGYGFMKSYDSQIVFHAVSDVVAEVIDRSGGEKKR